MLLCRLFLFLFLFGKFGLPTNNVFIKYYDPVTGEKKVGIFSDRMHTHVNEFPVIEDFQYNNNIYGKMNNQQIRDEHRTFTTNQKLGAPFGKMITFKRAKKDREFVIAINGNSKVVEAFQDEATEQNGQTGSLKKLAKRLDTLYRETGEKNSQEFLVSDGKEIYGVKVGRNKKQPFKQLFGRMSGKIWPNGKVPPSNAAPPRIRRKKGNLHVTGCFSENLENILKPNYGGRKRARKNDGELMDDLKAAFLEQSAYLSKPNGVSASFDGFVYIGKGKLPAEFKHYHEGEKESLANLGEIYDLQRTRQKLQRTPGLYTSEWKNIRKEQLKNWQKNEIEERTNVWGQREPKWRRKYSADLGMVDRLVQPAPKMVDPILEAKLLSKSDSTPDLRFTGYKDAAAMNRKKYGRWHRYRQWIG